MRACFGVMLGDYRKEDGVRISNVPVYHAPDLCPFLGRRHHRGL